MRSGALAAVAAYEGLLLVNTPTRSLLDPLRQVRVSLVHWDRSTAIERTDELAAEEPLEVRLRPMQSSSDVTAETVAVILRTPGHDDELAAGFLFSEGILAAAGELAGIVAATDVDGLPSENVVDVIPAPDVDLQRRVREEGYSRRFAVNASCGVCGKNSVAAACAALPPLPPDEFTVSPATLYSLPEQLRSEQRVFSHTGGLHAAALFDATGHLLALREDVGRHNAVDKLVGRALLDGQIPLGEQVLLVSGRLSYEIVLKALVARIPVIAAVSAPSSLAVDLADASGITVAAFLRGESLNVYTHPFRIHL